MKNTGDCTIQFLSVIGIPGNTDWAKELNFGVEKFVSDRFYGYVGIAWSSPDAAAKEIFGDKDFTVIQTYLSLTF